MNPKDQKDQNDQRNKQTDSNKKDQSSGYQSPGSSQAGSGSQKGSQGGRDDSAGWTDTTDGSSSGNKEPRRSPGGQPDSNTRKADRETGGNSSRQGGGMSDTGSDRNAPRRDPND